MAPIRIRHSKGATTIQVDLESQTVQDLQQEIYSITELLPSQQDLKTGYPPRSLDLAPDLPVTSLGLKSGDQIIVGQKTGSSSASGPAPSSSKRTIPSTYASNPPASRTAAVKPESAVRPSQPAPPAPAPARRPSPPRQAALAPAVGSGGPDAVEIDGSFLIHRIVPDDNACMFSAVSLIFKQSIRSAQQMRQFVADGINADPERWNEGILGMSSQSYISKILSPNVWGGAIDLTILAEKFDTEIVSVDVETGTIYRFEPASHPSNRALVLYSGIHYDAATLAPMKDAPDEWHQTVFPINNEDPERDTVLIAAKQLATILRGKRAYTNTATFDIKCEDCGTKLKGEKGANEHAKQTGHVRFGEC